LPAACFHLAKKPGPQPVHGNYPQVVDKVYEQPKATDSEDSIIPGQPFPIEKK
jgi:hypothetical protein